MAFEKLVKGLKDWHNKYNSDFEAVHIALANKANKEDIPDSVDLSGHNNKPDAHPAIWAELTKKVDVGVPNEYQLTLHEGYTMARDVAGYENLFYKTHDNLVVIEFNISPKGGAFEAGLHTVATLPVGFRPKSTKHCATYVYNGAFINPTGELTFSVASSVEAIHGTFVFVAAQ